MYSTPSSRTSKHEASRRAQHRNNRKPRSVQRPATSVTTDPERVGPMHSPPADDAASVGDDKRELLTISIMDRIERQSRAEHQVGDCAHEVPEFVFGEERTDEGGDSPDPLAWNALHENHMLPVFDPFDASTDVQTHNPTYEFCKDAEDMPVAALASAPASPVPAALRLADFGENAEQTEPGFGALSDIMEPVQLAGDPAHEQVSAVTRLDSPPISPPRSSGRTRAPILATRNPVSPSSLSRQLQNVQALLPTSPQLPSLGFSNPLTNFAAPRISNVTVSGSSFNHPTSRSSTDPFVSTKEARRRSMGNYAEGRDRDRARLKMTPHVPKPSDSDEDAMPSTTAVKHTRYPTSSVGNDKVVFASFATLAFSSAHSSPLRLLFIGYENGLQIWDTTHLGEVREVLNRRISGAVVGCSVLPVPRPSIGLESLEDAFADRPLIGIVVEEHDTCYLLVYSLATHEVVKKLDFSGASISSLQASDSFIVVSTISPPSLHILCARTLNILHTIQSRQLSIFSRPVSIHTPEGTVESIYSARQDRPHAVFALSSRLLAFASVPPTPETPSLTNIYPRMAIPHSPAIQLGPLNVSQADIGNAALKVGGGLLSGMKTLGGIAVAVARGERNSSASGESGGGLRKFFSKSAPAATSADSLDRKTSFRSSGFRQAYLDEQGAASRGISRPDEACSSSMDSAHVTALDLQPLLDDRESGRPERLSDFSMPNGQIIAGLKFSEDGTSLAVVPNDGGVVRLYQIKPRSRVLRRAALNSVVHSARDRPGPGLARKDSTGDVESHAGLVFSDSEAMASNTPWHLYDLRRGRTSGVIEAVNHSADGRWVGVSTRKRTIHLFATNPYGGKPDEASHIEGRVKNVNEIQPLSTEVRPIVRLRSSPVSSPEQLAVPVAFSFVSSSSESLPTKFLPSHSAFSPPSSVSSSLPSSAPHRRAQSVSPRLPPRPTNYQDILVFDPSDGSLSLRRLTISTRIGETGSSFLASLPIPSATSISLPGMGFIGRPSASPPKAAASASTPPVAEQFPTELVAKDSMIATWNLMRDSKWSDVKEPLTAEREPQEQRRVMSKSEWLAQAELSTSSRSTSVLPGSIYLSHQFLFFALGEDYHALIRRLHFDIPVEKIDVRREVEASAYTTGRGEAFVSATSSPQDVRAGRSFDEPLASAIFTGLDISGSSPPVIPMLPNGVRRPGSFKSAIPIRSVAAGLTEGVNESFGRLTRGIRKVRSPRLVPLTDDGELCIVHVPLEFDEEDVAEFLREPKHDLEHEREPEQENNENDNDNDTMSNSGGGHDSRSLSTPSTNNNAPLPGDELEPDGWLDNMDAVEEAERFDEISAAGFMGEEQMPIRVPEVGQKGRAGRGGKGR